MVQIKRGLFYSQPALGIGQLTRSLNICRCLLPFSEIDFLLGSPSLDQNIDHPHFHFFQIPPLWIEQWSDPPILVDPYHKNDSETIFKERAQHLRQFENKYYDYFLIELYPFSKQKFGQEIENLIKNVRTVNPNCLVICSCRDIIGKKSNDEEAIIVEKIKNLFSYVFVHADPFLISLEETFRKSQEIKDQIIYTGYVSNPLFSFLMQERKNQIVISMGSGAYGEELAKAVMVTALFLKDYTFLFLMGPKSSESLRIDLNQMKKTFGLPHVKIADFSDRFDQILSESSLSISLGGSTLVDAAKTRTPALVFAQAHVEHELRAKKFASKGFVKLLTLADLLPQNLIKIIYEQIHTPFPDSSINLSGAENTALEVQRILNHQE